MKILVTGASGNVGKGMTERLKAAGHELVLHDLGLLPEGEPFAGLPFVQGDAQQGIGFDRAAAGCDLILHTPAWHGIHTRQRTEVDFWRLNVDGAFWIFQAAAHAGVKRLVFMSSLAWYGHYDKYGFTKRVGEELCEYYRRNHGIRFVAVRPSGFVPWRDWVNQYGAELLYGRVDREDVLDCVQCAIERLAGELPEGAEPEGIAATAHRANPFTEEQLEGWEADPLAACERIFPGSRRLVEKYQIHIARKPHVVNLGDTPETIGYRPQRHFGTFLQELARLDAEGGEAAAVRCAY
jgi:NAD(P)-dependent dehydrogenase (short-subunit alcohol dehydrogenase family)